MHTMGRKKLKMEEKSRALTMLEKGDSVIAVAKDLGVSREAFYQLKRSAAKLPTGTVPQRKSGSGAPKKTTPRTDQLLNLKNSKTIIKRIEKKKKKRNSI